MRGRTARALLLLAATAALDATQAAAQENRDVQVVREQKPVYPEGALKTRREGNVVLVGRIDAKGVLHDVTPTAASLPVFVDPAIAAVKQWQFRPAVKAGQPVEVAANLAFQFRIDDQKRGEQVEGLMLGDIRVLPADASGQPVGPDGFPLQLSAGARVRVEAGLDVARQTPARTVDVAVQAISPSGKVSPLWQDRVTVAPGATRASVAFTAPVAWNEDGVWRLRFLADQKDAGTAIVWAAADPAAFNFAAAMKKLPPLSATR